MINVIVSTNYRPILFRHMCVNNFHRQIVLQLVIVTYVHIAWYMCNACLIYQMYLQTLIVLLVVLDRCRSELSWLVGGGEEQFLCADTLIGMTILATPTTSSHSHRYNDCYSSLLPRLVLIQFVVVVAISSARIACPLNIL